MTFVCKNCGAAVNLIPKGPKSEVHLVEEDWLCLPPDGFEWKLPAGKITPVVGSPIYISAIGEHLSRGQYIEKYQTDPEVAYQFMRRRLGVHSASTTDDVNRILSSRPSTKPPMRTQSNADRDYWSD